MLDLRGMPLRLIKSVSFYYGSGKHLPYIVM